MLATMNAAVEKLKRPGEVEQIKQRLEKELELLIHDKDSIADSKALLSREDSKRLISFISDCLKNHVVKLVGKNEYTYSPYLMGLTLNQFLRGRSAYEDYREHAPFVIPSPETHAKKRHHFKLSTESAHVSC